MRVGVFGGSFDPPHVGHVFGVVYALAVAEVDRVLVVPTFEHPFAKGLSAFSSRLRLCDRAFRGLPDVEVSAVEASLEKPSFTRRTLSHLRSEHPSWALRLIVGSDVLSEAERWQDFEDVKAMAPLFILGRRGHPLPGVSELFPDISSTRVRDVLAKTTKPSEHPELRRLVPRAVLDYIEEHGLYAHRTNS